MKLGLLAVSAMALVSSAASADTVYNTSLQNLNGTIVAAGPPPGAGTYATTTDATGTRTTVTGAGPNNGANRAYGTPVLNTWFQNEIGYGSTVGITTDHARSGNGSAYFSQTTANNGKGNLIYGLGNSDNRPAPVALSSLTGVSFDFFRSSSSTTDPNLAPVLRLDILKDNVFAGSLVLENVYQNQTAAPVDAWTTLTSDLNSGIWWATNSALGPTFADANGGQKTLAAWLAGNSTSNLTVSAIEIGFGSGWSGTFDGAVDNVSVNFASRSINSNFEVAAVPEPSSWAMMVGGFGMLGFAMRRRRRTAVSFG